MVNTVSCITQTSDGLRAANALLGELLREAVSAERFLITRSELLSDQHLVAASTREAFAVPRSALVRDTSLVDHLYPDAANNVPSCFPCIRYS